MDHEEIYPRPLSDRKIEKAPPALLPSRVPLVGSGVTFEPLNADLHAAELFDASHGSENAIRSGKSGMASGQASFLDNHTFICVTEIDHIWYGPSLQ